MRTTKSSFRRRSQYAVAAMTLVAGAALLAVPGTASADAGCPSGFVLLPTAAITSQGTFYGLQSADLNKDGLSCVRYLSNSPTELAFMDNRLP